MTSEERRASRRQRREENRRKKRSAAVGSYDNYEQVIDANHLVKAVSNAAKGVSWKASVKKYKTNYLRGIWASRKDLKSGKSPVKGFICFQVRERGKTRQIKAVHFSERVVQKSLCDNALVPVLRYPLVYDNGASLKGKGIHFAIERCKRHLREYYSEHGNNDGWILLIDFHGYFDNILHEPIKEMILQSFNDKHLRWLIWQFVKSFGDKSLGLGSQVSQILAVSYANKVDHYVKEVLHVGKSARYNDDIYLMHESRQYLQECLAQIKTVLFSLGIELNEKKTKIIPLKKFTFLKARFSLRRNGKITVRGNRESFKRMRHKLKYFRRMLTERQMTFKKILTGYQSWYGYQNHNDGHKALRAMDRLFYDLFNLWIPHPRKNKKSNSLKRRVRFMWCYIDDNGFVRGMNSGNMDGNTGWVEAATTMTVMDELSQDGEPMYCVKDGVVVKRDSGLISDAISSTQEAEYIKQKESDISQQEKLEMLLASIVENKENKGDNGQVFTVPLLDGTVIRYVDSGERMGTGTKEDPLQFVDGDPITQGLYYCRCKVSSKGTFYRQLTSGTCLALVTSTVAVWPEIKLTTASNEYFKAVY